MRQRKRRTMSPIVYEEPQSPIAEAFRTIRTNLQFMGLKTRTKVVLVTSSQAGEGKTSTICNLAVAVAQSGKKVLIIDADLRKPTVHKWFELSNFCGLSNYLIEQSPLAEYVSSTEVPSLFVLPSGAAPPLPSELLESLEFSKLIEDVKHAYDLILIDSPPVLAVADALILAQVADGTVFVVNSRKTSHFQARHGVEALEQVHARMLGVILNRAEERKSKYEYYSNRMALAEQ